MEPTKAERLRECFKRLEGLPRAASFEEARKQVDETLNAVGNELTAIPFNPDAWQRDGRMYPVRDDNIRTDPQHPWVKRLRSFAHNIYISTNGAVEIRVAGSSEAVFSKPGMDGKGVWEQ
jgi:hypothetical protein